MISVVAVLDHIVRPRDSGGAMRFIRNRQIASPESRKATLREVTMGLLRLGFCLGFFTALSFATLVPFAQAENGKPAPLNRHAPAVLTGKERLGPKWTDEQRIDNCN